MYGSWGAHGFPPGSANPAYRPGAVPGFPPVAATGYPASVVPGFPPGATPGFPAATAFPPGQQMYWQQQGYYGHVPPQMQAGMAPQWGAASTPYAPPQGYGSDGGAKMPPQPGADPIPPIEPPKEEAPPLPAEPPPPEDVQTQNPEETAKLTELQQQAAAWQQQQQQQQQWQEYQQSLVQYQQQLQQWNAQQAAVLEAIKQEEKEFETQYADWMKQYNDWKEQNKNHPNREQYAQYEAQWKQYETQMAEKREHLSQRKQQAILNLQQAQALPPATDICPPQPLDGPPPVANVYAPPPTMPPPGVLPPAGPPPSGPPPSGPPQSGSQQSGPPQSGPPQSGPHQSGPHQGGPYHMGQPPAGPPPSSVLPNQMNVPPPGGAGYPGVGRDPGRQGSMGYAGPPGGGMGQVRPGMPGNQSGGGYGAGGGGQGGDGMLQQQQGGGFRGSRFDVGPQQQQQQQNQQQQNQQQNQQQQNQQQNQQQLNQSQMGFVKGNEDAISGRDEIRPPQDGSFGSGQGWGGEGTDGFEPRPGQYAGRFPVPRGPVDQAGGFAGRFPDPRGLEFQGSNGRFPGPPRGPADQNAGRYPGPRGDQMQDPRGDQMQGLGGRFPGPRGPTDQDPSMGGMFASQDSNSGDGFLMPRGVQFDSQQRMPMVGRGMPFDQGGSRFPGDQGSYRFPGDQGGPRFSGGAQRGLAPSHQEGSLGGGTPELNSANASQQPGSGFSGTRYPGDQGGFAQRFPSDRFSRPPMGFGALQDGNAMRQSGPRGFTAEGESRFPGQYGQGNIVNQPGADGRFLGPRGPGQMPADPRFMGPRGPNQNTGPRGPNFMSGPNEGSQSETGPGSNQFGAGVGPRLAVLRGVIVSDIRPSGPRAPGQSRFDTGPPATSEASQPGDAVRSAMAAVQQRRLGFGQQPVGSEGEGKFGDTRQPLEESGFPESSAGFDMVQRFPPGGPGGVTYRDQEAYGFPPGPGGYGGGRGQMPSQRGGAQPRFPGAPQPGMRQNFAGQPMRPGFGRVEPVGGSTGAEPDFGQQGQFGEEGGDDEYGEDFGNEEEGYYDAEGNLKSEGEGMWGDQGGDGQFGRGRGNMSQFGGPTGGQRMPGQPGGGFGGRAFEPRVPGARFEPPRFGGMGQRFDSRAGGPMGPRPPMGARAQGGPVPLMALKLPPRPTNINFDDAEDPNAEMEDFSFDENAPSQDKLQPGGPRGPAPFDRGSGGVGGAPMNPLGGQPRFRPVFPGPAGNFGSTRGGVGGPRFGGEPPRGGPPGRGEGMQRMGGFNPRMPGRGRVGEEGEELYDGYQGWEQEEGVEDDYGQTQDAELHLGADGQPVLFSEREHDLIKKAAEELILMSQKQKQIDLLSSISASSVDKAGRHQAGGGPGGATGGLAPYGDEENKGDGFQDRDMESRFRLDRNAPPSGGLGGSRPPFLGANLPLRKIPSLFRDENDIDDDFLSPTEGGDSFGRGGGPPDPRFVDRQGGDVDFRRRPPPGGDFDQEFGRPLIEEMEFRRGGGGPPPREGFGEFDERERRLPFGEWDEGGRMDEPEWGSLPRFPPAHPPRGERDFHAGLDRGFDQQPLGGRRPIGFGGRDEGDELGGAELKSKVIDYGHGGGIKAGGAGGRPTPFIEGVLDDADLDPWGNPLLDQGDFRMDRGGDGSRMDSGRGREDMFSGERDMRGGRPRSRSPRMRDEFGRERYPFDQRDRDRLGGPGGNNGRGGRDDYRDSSERSGGRDLDRDRRPDYRDEQRDRERDRERERGGLRGGDREGRSDSNDRRDRDRGAGGPRDDHRPQGGGPPPRPSSHVVPLMATPIAPPVAPPPEVRPRVETISVDDLINLPGRLSRPEHTAVIIRGPPGAGKTYVSKLLKDKETANGGAAPRMLCLDDYFLSEIERLVPDPETGKSVRRMVAEYEYDAKLEPAYRASFLKSFRRQIDDCYFSFIIVDAVFDKLAYLEEFWSYAKSKGFQVYVVEMQADVATCVKRNTHNRKQPEIQKMIDMWEEPPRHYIRLDVRPLLQDAAIEDVEMEDSVPVEEQTGSQAKETSQKDEPEEDVEPGYIKSKWELDTSEEHLDKLDGIHAKKHDQPGPQRMEDYLQLPDDYESRLSKPGKKRVRWADIEERKDQTRRREIGFVVGQTDWAKMTADDSYVADRALNRTKYI